MQTMQVQYNEQPIYDIVFADSYEYLESAIEALDIKQRRICVVSESNVAPHYLKQVMSIFEKTASMVTSYVFPAGEASKNLSVVQKLYEHLILSGFDRKDILVALGGGVVGDLTGYTAATYLRGIDFIQMPTSLLSQVDSSIGGKTGVDFDAYKNMVGAFHQPKLVYINLATLKTLKEKEYLSGMGEIIKHGLIKDMDYYEWIKANLKGVLDCDLTVMEEMVYRSCDIKRRVVESDPKELTGERALLNYGHTIGHAVEKLMNFSMLHGECVAVGAVAAAYISMKRGYISEAMYQDIRDCFKMYRLPVQVEGPDAENVLKTTRMDKKMDAGHIKFVLLNPQGHAVVDRTVTDDEMRAAIAEIICK